MSFKGDYAADFVQAFMMRTFRMKQSVNWTNLQANQLTGEDESSTKTRDGIRRQKRRIIISFSLPSFILYIYVIH